MPDLKRFQRWRVGPRQSRGRELVVLACDVSPSMLMPLKFSQGRQTSRLAGAQQAMRVFVSSGVAAGRAADVCVVTFSGVARLDRRWTPVHIVAPLIKAIDGISFVGEGTNIAAALKLSLAQIRRRQSGRHITDARIVLVTDGDANLDTYQHEQLIKEARRRQVRIFPIAICNKGDDPMTYDRDLLLRIAKATRGQFRTAHDFDQLRAALALR